MLQLGESTRKKYNLIGKIIMTKDGIAPVKGKMRTKVKWEEAESTALNEDNCIKVDNRFQSNLLRPSFHLLQRISTDCIEGNYTSRPCLLLHTFFKMFAAKSISFQYLILLIMRNFCFQLQNSPIRGLCTLLPGIARERPICSARIVKAT
jgi:hypothetical protein